MAENPQTPKVLRMAVATTLLTAIVIAMITVVIIAPINRTQERCLADHERNFLEALSGRDLQHYFGVDSIDAVPDFDLMWTDCVWASGSRDLQGPPRRCQLLVQGESLVLGLAGSEGPLSCPPLVERNLNATMSSVWRGDGGRTCCRAWNVLEPPHTHGHLAMCWDYMGGNIILGGRRLHVQSVLSKHMALALIGQQRPGLPLIGRFYRPSPSGQGGGGDTHPSSVAVRAEHTHLPTGAAGLWRQRRSPVGGDLSHLELLVVVGWDVQQVHRQDTERYVLTNLNIASELLRDSTLGANLRIHLVRMIILDEPEPGIRMSSNISSSLRSVCEWGNKVNPPNDSDPLHADLLLYITRYDLVLPNGNKLVRGVTQLGGVCSSQWSCVITEDTGFDLGITIAHEIGHSFGIQHDGVGNTCSSSGFMMASDGGYNSVDLTWSPCSHQQLLAFYRSGGAECVSDLPEMGGSLQDWKPGLYYGVDDQCRIAFGSAARACSFTANDMAACRVLSCHTSAGDQTSCTRLLVPLLDGTECAPNQWCLRGRCVSPSQVSNSMLVHGSWSPWTHTSPCSRTCGGGVAHRTRQCNNPRPAFGGRVCEGVDIEAQICNRQACVSSQLSFMAQQCSQTDPQPLPLSPGHAARYTWLPALGHVKGDLQCKLMCVSEGENFMVSRGSKFVDGTRCQPEKPSSPGIINACLSGACQEFGCDGVLHSGKVEDVCGVCGGNGSSCSLTTHTYRGGEAKAYTTFLTVPLNATQVRITNTRPVFTHMAVLLDGRYVVSGGGSISLNFTHPSSLEDDAVTHTLLLTPDHLPLLEHIHTPGPVQHLMHIQVYRKYGKEYGEQTDPNITYQFYTPSGRHIHTHTHTLNSPRGQWILRPGACSVTCGKGKQEVVCVCEDQVNGKLLDERLCEGTATKIPDTHTDCHMPACPPSWEVGEFGPCSAPCGGGNQVRSVRCVWQGEGSNDGAGLREVSASRCTQDTRPSDMRRCGTEPCPTRWRVSDPGVCSAVCGPGMAMRNVSCVRIEGGVGVNVGEELCDPPRPPGSVPCVVDVCPVGWENIAAKADLGKVGHPEFRQRSDSAQVFVWSPLIGHCSSSCGNGTRNIWFTCVDHRSRLGVAELHCDAASKPEPHTQPCSSQPCPTTWHYKQGVCSVSCGGGVARRVLYCARTTNEESEELLSDSQCNTSPKPANVVECNTQPCPARWKVSRVSVCSASCGLGVAERTVVCVRAEFGQEAELVEDRCSHLSKPRPLVPCRVQMCTFTWNTQPWSQCSVPCGRHGIQTRGVSCVGPAHPGPVSPLLCMQHPKPITIQACYSGPCNTSTHTHTQTHPTHTPANQHTHTTSLKGAEPDLALPTQETNSSHDAVMTSSMKPSKYLLQSPAPSQESVAMETPMLSPPISPCGQLFLEPSGTIDLRNATERKCLIAIGRPLHEVINVHFHASTLQCRAKEYVALYDRLILMRKCERIVGKEVTSRTNVLRIRQGRITPGNGVLLSYSSRKNPKASRQTYDCDVQLFGMSGMIENPTRSPAPTSNQPMACRVFLDAPPTMLIRIQALTILNTTATHTSYVLVRDVDTLQTEMFSGHQLFLWSSVGCRAELEFHGEYTHTPRAFHAQYTFIKP